MKAGWFELCENNRSTEWSYKNENPPICFYIQPLFFYLICQGCSQSKLARNLPYLMFSAKPMVKVLFVDFLILTYIMLQVSFYTPLKHSNTFSDIFRCYRKRPAAWNSLIEIRWYSQKDIEYRYWLEMSWHLAKNRCQTWLLTISKFKWVN